MSMRNIEKQCRKFLDQRFSNKESAQDDANFWKLHVRFAWKLPFARYRTPSSVIGQPRKSTTSNAKFSSLRRVLSVTLEHCPKSKILIFLQLSNIPRMPSELKLLQAINSRCWRSLQLIKHLKLASVILDPLNESFCKFLRPTKGDILYNPELTS